MGCSGCSVDGGKPNGCKSNGGCSTGGCNRMNTYDWLSKMDIYDPMDYDIVEVSFKNGARKSFFKNDGHTRAQSGDLVVVDAGNGYDLGKLSLSGDLVRLQLKKRKVKESEIFPPVIRVANTRDLEKLDEARSLEKNALMKARAIARTLGLEMKLGDVEYRADKRKATFYYTADNRVDFRELVRSYAREFKVKIEMRQIGARQESARIGGIGSCGRELCCSTWLSDFKSVSTNAARYQNLSINQSKLSGQCGRLKCCLNYELDTYMDALEDFPKHADILVTENGKARLIKMDIFKKLMYYAMETERGRGAIVPLKVERVKEVLALNKKGEKVETLQNEEVFDFSETKEKEVAFSDDVTGVIELPAEKKRRKRGRRNKKNPQNKSGNNKHRGQNKKQSNNPNSKNKSNSEKNQNPKNRSNSNKGKSNKNRNKQKNNNSNNKTNQK
ncbi:MAG: regulatory iron-sulfur-containing complex subunit RicT [Bacteroidota bacterium]